MGEATASKAAPAFRRGLRDYQRDRLKAALHGTPGGMEPERRQANIRAPVGEEGRMVRCAVWRAVDGGHLIDRMRDRGQLAEPLYQNAAALLAVWEAAKLRQRAVATYAPVLPGGRPLSRDAETAWLQALDALRPADALLRAMIVEEAHPGWRADVARRGLASLDWLAVDFDGECWRDDR